MGSSVSPSIRAAFEHVEDPVIIADPSDGACVVHVNAAFERASGYASREAVGRSIEELLRPRVVAGEPDVVVMTRANGEDYVVRRRRAPLDPATHEGSLVVEVHRDVTAERALGESEALYRKLAERSSDLISRTDSHGRCIYMSPSCRQVLGYEPDELIGRLALIDLAHPEDRARQHEVLANFVRHGITSPTPLCIRIRRKDGTYAWLETLTHVERDPEGRIVEVQSWARDVSARMLAEQALSQSQAGFRSLLDRLPDGVAVHRDGVILYANPEMLRMIACDRAEDLVGRSLLDFVHPDERDSVRERLRDDGRPGARSRERRIVARDGSERVLEVTALPVIFEGAVAFVAICHDVTQRKQMEERLALAERMALVGRLASGVGHEINNPLAYMLGSLELARADLAAFDREAPAREGLERLERHVRTVREGAERVRDIVRDLKSLSATSEDRLGPVDVEHALDVAAATAAHEIRLRARLVKEYGSVARAWASEGRLTQVFVNLLVNAAQAIPDGEAHENEIRISTHDEGEHVVVEIRDTGTGIAPQDLPRIFEPFFTTKAKGVGTGLGLSISHAIVAAHGGTLTAEPSSPRGALFRVTLRASIEASAPLSPRGAPVSDGPRGRVLLVDDEPRTAIVLAELLSQHDVTLAHSGREAIARLAADVSFDAIVCDLQMNDGTGVDVYEYLIQRAPDLARRVIFMTGGAFTQTARAFLDRCPQPVLEKPFESTSLAALVGGMIRPGRTNR
ncbi:MAG TPA: PAS domain S-box protein [Polyangiaceae bacterium]